jgi:uncharacterized protein (TIGR03435 family)
MCHPLLRALGTAAVLVALGSTYAESLAQSQPNAPPLSFDVASIKRADQPFLEIAPKRSGGHFTWTTDLQYVVTYAYRLATPRISGTIPGSEYIFRLEAVTSPDATDDQIRVMLQSLLAERFKMVSHRVTRKADCYVLSAGKKRLKIKPAAADDQPAPLPEWFRSRSVAPAVLEGKVMATMEGPGISTITGRRATMAQFTDALQRVLQAIVVDETGLSGNYYFALRYAQENAPPDTDAPPLFAVIQQELGLKLEKRKRPVEVLVVDHIEKTPTEN